VSREEREGNEGLIILVLVLILEFFHRRGAEARRNHESHEKIWSKENGGRIKIPEAGGIKNGGSVSCFPY
jgi:hypothetical protein